MVKESSRCKLIGAALISFCLGVLVMIVKDFELSTFLSVSDSHFRTIRHDPGPGPDADVRDGRNEYAIKIAAVVDEWRWTSDHPKPSCIIQPIEEPTDSKKFNPKLYDEIYFYHVRKAGGSTLRDYLAHVAHHYGLAFNADEGERGRNGAEKKKLDELAFYVTTVREPVSRSLSQYKYEFRWSCKDLTKPDFKPTRRNAQSLMNWINGGFECKSDESRHLNCMNQMWACSYNCLIRWFTNQSATENFQLAYKEALDNIYGYNLIVQERYFKNDWYIDQLEEFFGYKGFREREPFCADESRAANAKFPLIITNDEMEILKTKNSWDTKFYEEVIKCDHMGLAAPKL